MHISQQASERKRTEQVSKKCTTGLVGWLVLYSLVLVNLNVTKQHQPQNFKNLVHEMVFLQPQDLPNQSNCFVLGVLGLVRDYTS